MFQARCEKLIYNKVSKFDKNHIKNIQACGEYAEDIHCNMKDIEKIALASGSYMKR